MVGIQDKIVRVWELRIEPHSLLEPAHFLHTPHIFVLRDENRLEALSERLDINSELSFFYLWHLGSECL